MSRHRRTQRLERRRCADALEAMSQEEIAYLLELTRRATRDGVDTLTPGELEAVEWIVALVAAP
jgi:hypothetical protein